MLAKRNVHERDDKITFIEETHQYWYENKCFTSVTTVINSLFKKFDQKEMIMKILNSPTRKEIYKNKTFHEIEEMWDNNKKEAVDAGLLLHKDIEDFYNEKLIDNNSMEYNYFLRFVDDHKDQFIPYRSEWKIFDEDHHIAGTIDMCFVRNGYLEIIDWKRCRNITTNNPFRKFSSEPYLSHVSDTNFSHYALQLNFYKYIIEKKYKKLVSSMYIVCLHPENKNNNYIMMKVPEMKKEIKLILKHLKNKLSK